MFIFKQRIWLVWRIDVPVVWIVVHLGMTLWQRQLRVERSRTKRVRITCILTQRSKRHSCCNTWTSLSDDGSLLFWASFFASCEGQGWQQRLVPHAKKRVFREWIPDEWVPHEDALCTANCRQIGVLHILFKQTCNNKNVVVLLFFLFRKNQTKQSTSNC